MSCNEPEVVITLAMVPTRSHLQSGFLGSFSCIFPILIRWTTFSARLAWFLPGRSTPADIFIQTWLAHFFLGGVGVGLVGIGHCVIFLLLIFLLDQDHWVQ